MENKHQKILSKNEKPNLNKTQPTKNLQSFQLATTMAQQFIAI
jgi:hypothetical protein